jgi:hypothetical protein
MRRRGEKGDRMAQAPEGCQLPQTRRGFVRFRSARPRSGLARLNHEQREAALADLDELVAVA